MLPRIVILKNVFLGTHTLFRRIAKSKSFIIRKSFLNNESAMNNNVIRSLKIKLLLLGVSFTALGSFVVIQFGGPEQGENGQILSDELSVLPVWKQYLLRTLRHIENFALSIQEPSREKLLPDPVGYPYYQPPYTLVLEFTDVLAHAEWTYQTGWRFKKRPGVDYLLESLAGLYEIIVFTAEQGITIFPVIDALDQKNLISYKLVRDSTHFIEGHHVKNLDKLNRDLKKVIVIDWNEKSLKFHPDNHFALTRWKGNDDDQTLIDLTSFLKTVANTNIEDVREVLRFYKQFDDPLSTFKRKQIEFFENQDKTTKQSRPQPYFKKVFDRLL